MIFFLEPVFISDEKILLFSHIRDALVENGPFWVDRRDIIKTEKARYIKGCTAEKHTLGVHDFKAGIPVEFRDQGSFPERPGQLLWLMSVEEGENDILPFIDLRQRLLDEEIAPMLL